MVVAQTSSAVTPPWRGTGKRVALDLTVIHPASKTCLSASAVAPGAAAAAAAAAKRKYYQQKKLQSDLIFIPLVWETFGYWHTEVVEFMRSLAQLHCSQLDAVAASARSDVITPVHDALEPRLPTDEWFYHPFTRRAAHRLSTELMRGNAEIMRLHLQKHLGSPAYQAADLDASSSDHPAFG